MASHPRKFIVQPTEDDLNKFPEAIRHLVKKGREQRYVTHQEIISALPNAEEDVDLLDEVYMLFVDLGIEVIDVKDALIWEKKGKAGLSVPDPAEDLAEIVTDESVVDEEADVAFLDKIQEAESASDVFLRNADDETEVCFRQLLLGTGISF